MKHRRWVWTWAVPVASLGPSLAVAQAPYPTKPIRFLIGFPPGGTNDMFARALAPKLTDALGQPVIVENRGGASTGLRAERDREVGQSDQGGGDQGRVRAAGGEFDPDHAAGSIRATCSLRGIT